MSNQSIKHWVCVHAGKLRWTPLQYTHPYLFHVSLRISVCFGTDNQVCVSIIYFTVLYVILYISIWFLNNYLTFGYLFRILC